MGDIDVVVVESLETLDPEWPIREAEVNSEHLMTPRPAIVG